MKNALKTLVVLLIILGTIVGFKVYSQAEGEVFLNQSFTLVKDEERKMNGYPVSIRYNRITGADCNTTKECAERTVFFSIYYPLGSKEIELSSGEIVTYKGASLVLSNIDEDGKATLYATASMLPHSAGTNIKTPDGTIWFITEHYTRRPYPTAHTFLSYKFNNWNSVVLANEADLNLPVQNFGNSWQSNYMTPRTGSLINDNGTIYIISNDFKVGFASDAILRGGSSGFQYSYSNVYNDNLDHISNYQPLVSANDRHPVGTLVNDNGTYYIMGSYGKYGVPSIEVLESWGYWLSDSVPANSYDRELFSSSTLTTRPPGKLTVD